MKLSPTRLAALAALSLSGVTLAAGTAEARPISQDGLVNVAADDVNVQVPISVAAVLCDVGVNVLATEFDIGDVECNAEGVTLAENDSENGGPVRQRGLVNVSLTDINVQVPVSVAAAVCGVSVGVLAQAASLGDVECTALSDSVAVLS